MSLYLAIAAKAFRRTTTYRSAFVGAIITNAFFGALICAVYTALYGAGGSVAGLSLNDAISYTWATQAMISLGCGWITSTEISSSIYTGDVVTDLSRPWSFYLYWLSRSLGERVCYLILRSPITYAIGILLFGARVPSPTELLAFLPAIGLSMLISFGFSFVVNLASFWLIDNTGVLLMANLLISFFSGFLMPLAFFPPALQTIARALPFQAITALPAQIVLGQLTGPALAEALGVQLLWAITMTLAGLACQGAAMRKVVLQGG